MKVSRDEMAAIHKLLSEHQAHEEVQGYDPDILERAVKGSLTVWHALAFGTVIALSLLWGAGVIGAVIEWAK